MPYKCAACGSELEGPYCENRHSGAAKIRSPYRRRRPPLGGKRGRNSGTTKTSKNKG